MAKELGAAHYIVDSISQNARGEPVKHGGGGGGGAKVGDTCNNGSSERKSDEFGSWRPDWLSTETSLLWTLLVSLLLWCLQFCFHQNAYQL